MDYLTWPDYLVLVAFLVISVGIGVYHSLTGGRQKTTSEFIMANRALNVIPTALSLLVSFQSAIMILGMTAEIYSYGSLYMTWAPVTITMSIILTTQVAVPWLYPLKLVSINEYLERRFRSKSVRMLGATISITYAILYMGSAMYAPSAALQSATGLPILFSVPVMAIVSIVYTALGGMRAVIWTDVFQSVIISGGLLTILIKGLVVVGGFDNAIQLISLSGRINWSDYSYWSPDPTVRHTFWGFLLGYSTTWFGMYGLSQGGVQRYSATKSLSQARLAVFLNMPAFILLNLLVCLTGLVAVAYYASIGCDPLVNGEISNANQMLPRFVLQIFANAPGFAGLFLAALYGGALSSISTSLSGSAANCWEDFLQWKLMHWTESRKALFSRFLVVLLGISATGFAFIAAALPGPITQIVMVLLGATSGPLYGLFMLGGLNRYANWKGALVGGITSLAGSLWLTIGTFTMTRRHPTFPPLSVDGCTKPNNVTVPNYDDNSSSSTFHFHEDFSINTTMMNFRPPTNQTIEVPLQGLENFYSISYLWLTLLWILVTIIVGSLASFLFRDEEEEPVDETLLIDFRKCFRWRTVSKSETAPIILSLNKGNNAVVLPSEVKHQMIKDPIEKQSGSLAKETSSTPKQKTKVTNEATLGTRELHLMNTEVSKL